MKFFVLAILFPTIYKIFSFRTLNHQKIIFIEPSSPKLSDNFFLIYERLTSEERFTVKKHFLLSNAGKFTYFKNCLKMILDISDAKYIFLDEACDALGRIPFRYSTKVIQVWHACGAFKKFGFSTADSLFNPSLKEMQRFPFYRYCSLVAVSSPEVIRAYSEGMGLEPAKILPLGVSRTDLLFQQEYRENARDKFYTLMPSSRGKKIILYAPTFRGQVRQASVSDMLQIAELYHSLNDQYVLAIKYHPHISVFPAIPEECQQFARDFTHSMDIQELLCVADICISDYSSLIFEFSLFERPIILFAYDLEEYLKWRGFYYDYESMVPGPVLKTTSEIIDCILHIDQHFDLQRVKNFKDKFMSSCDGHSTDRLITYLKKNFDLC